MAKTTVIGGFHAVLAVLEDGHDKPFEILLAQGREDARMHRVRQLAAVHGVRVQSVSRHDLDVKAPGLKHQGVLAYVPEKAFDSEDFLYRSAEAGHVLLVLDGVQDPHNLGACLRTAEAAGVTAVIIPRDRSAGVTATVRKAAAGAAERVPLIAVTNLARTLERLKALGYWVTGLAGEGAESIFEVDLTGPVVLVMGAEGEGLRRLTRECCDHLAYIPMQGKTESLNVSVAAAVCLYECYRQRLPGGGSKHAKSVGKPRKDLL
ncbi:23S rRNA (guanosine(2251)-2'-O)-methyltransferase RlmB [Sinimarinibacterium sp. NLF-5-8]|uniref:23S rRNA (guanosine(2251)-2'-O)-methyltransferase RlmB n=1 Tax=Sinimarinibacterium sp. NLF-5-8 TaxID=2698684 RepID=UPI00137C34C3|nr:23S rRNA (guanosine(2251)-2'-O)-methyltransferase RlmB [Sinimarinibacterium sp. NLF-5-8]QHS09937.1 23S rRNA (guanosine(2251)-2'-O)-methyltransferase RlmB [Sinimarinibacterium sp. NLF-5-8]